MKRSKIVMTTLVSAVLSGFSLYASAGSAFAATISQQWVQTFVPSSSETGGNSSRMTTDSSGSSYIVTDLQNSANGQFGAYTIKYAPDGTKDWAAFFQDPAGATNQVYGSGVAVDASGNVYAAIQGPNNIYIVKYNSSGIEQWVKSQNGASINNSSYAPRTILLDASGNVYAVDTWRGGLITFKYDPDGNLLWSNEYGSQGDTAIGIAVDGSGDAYVAGDVGSDTVVIKYSPSGSTSWIATYDTSGFTNRVADVTLDASSQVYVAGYTQNNATSAQQFLTVKYNSDGSQAWAKTYALPGNAGGANAVKVAGSDGSVYVTGTSANGGWTAYTIKYSSAGTQTWVVTYAYNGQAQGNSLVLDSSDNVYVGGGGYSSVNSYAYTVIKYAASNGNQLGAASYDNPGFDIMRDMSLAADSAIVQTGMSCDVNEQNCHPVTVKFLQMLNAPANLTVQSPTNHFPVLSWSSDSDASFYNVYRNGALVDTISASNTNYTDTNAPEGTSTYFITAVSGDVESNHSNSVSVIYDTTSPNITYSLSPQPNSAGWNNSSVTVTFTCTDNNGGSGVASCSSPVTVNTPGMSLSITGTSVDKAGNTATTTASINVDETAPAISGPTMSKTTFLGGGTATVSATTSDTLSGVEGGEYYIDTDSGQGNGTALPYANGKISGTATIPSNLSIGRHKLYMRSRDVAGNWSATVSVNFTFI